VLELTIARIYIVNHFSTSLIIFPIHVAQTELGVWRRICHSGVTPAQIQEKEKEDRRDDASACARSSARGEPQSQPQSQPQPQR
jgi:hypothetical protein